MPSSVKDMLAAANATVPRIQATDLRRLCTEANVLIVDVRDAPELTASGKGKVLQELGYKSVYNAGAFKDLVEAGMETEAA